MEDKSSANSVNDCPRAVQHSESECVSGSQREEAVCAAVKGAEREQMHGTCSKLGLAGSVCVIPAEIDHMSESKTGQSKALKVISAIRLPMERHLPAA